MRPLQVGDKSISFRLRIGQVKHAAFKMTFKCFQRGQCQKGGRRAKRLVRSSVDLPREVTLESYRLLKMKGPEALELRISLEPIQSWLLGRWTLRSAASLPSAR